MLFFPNQFLYSVQLEPLQWANNDNSVHESPPDNSPHLLWPSPLRFPPTTGHEYKLRSSSPGTAGPLQPLVSNFWPRFACRRWLLNYWQINPDIWKTWTPLLPVTTLAAPAHSLTSPSHCVLFIISASGIFGQTKGCSFTGCLLAATQSKIMPCFCTFSYLCQIFLLNCVSVVVFAIHAQSWRLTATFLELGYPNTFSSINDTFI